MDSWCSEWELAGLKADSGGGEVGGLAEGAGDRVELEVLRGCCPRQSSSATNSSHSLDISSPTSK